MRVLDAVTLGAAEAMARACLTSYVYETTSGFLHVSSLSHEFYSHPLVARFHVSPVSGEVIRDC